MNESLLGFGLQILYAIGAFALGTAWNRSKDLTARQKAMENGTRAMLKMELCRIHRESVSSGHIGYNDEAIAEEIYNAYHSLGGNGQGTKMIDDIRRLHLSNAGKEQEV